MDKIKLKDIILKTLEKEDAVVAEAIYNNVIKVLKSL